MARRRFRTTAATFRRSGAGPRLCVGAVAFGAAFSRAAGAYDATVDATFDAQLYQVTSPFGSPALSRHRYTETLSLKVYDLQGDPDPKAPELDAVARLRVDTDFGVSPEERDPTNERAFVPGLQTTPLDIMMAYVEGRNYAGGLLGFRLGRQYVVDALGWWSFDGGLARITTPAHVAFETYGGFEQRGGLFMLSTSRFEGDGVSRGSRNGMPVDLDTSYLEESRLAPAYGFAVESTGLTWLSTRLTYRKVIDRDTVLVSPFADSSGNFATTGGDRVSSERVGWAGTLTAPGLGSLRGDVVYDLYSQRTSEYAASLDGTPIPALALGVDYEYFVPTFDGDSIWNWFSHFGTTTIQGRARVEPLHGLTFALTGGVRRFVTEGDPATYTSTTAAASADSSLYDVLGSLDALYKFARGTGSLRLMDEQGDRGKRRGGDVALRHFFDDGRYDANGVVSLYQWSDALRPDGDIASFSYVVGGGYRPFPKTRVGIEWEHSMNVLVGQRFRALATIDFTVL
jgi:hypothetical protein